MFKISARTVLELGAELISSDVIAFYELIKNALDAKSPTGAEIRFEIILRPRDYERFRAILCEDDVDIRRVRSDIANSIDVSAPQASLDRARKVIYEATDPTSLSAAMEDVHVNGNRIVVSDEGHGMSRRALTDNFLVIGTPSRKRNLDAAFEGGIVDGPPPFLGEKGIGRLSAMRLGDKLTVETAERTDRRLSRLQIDWSMFSGIDTMLEEVEVEPADGGAKPHPEWSGTRLFISALATDWTEAHLRKLGQEDFARLTDPFRDPRQRPRIALFWNGTRVPIATMDRHLLSHAHASICGKFAYSGSEPRLECTFRALDLGFEHPPEVDSRCYQREDLRGAISGTSERIPLAALERLGPIEFEAYWFNRRRLGTIDSIGDKALVQALQKRWSGIMLFRDGFRVIPYGDESDDWLELDRRAFGSAGYLLNKTQFIGRVQISRMANRRLVDQTNREGLRVGPEQQALLALLHLSLDDLRRFLRDVQRRHKNQPIDIVEADRGITDLITRTQTAIQRIRKSAPEESIGADLHNMFAELRTQFDRLRQRTQEVEKENREMLQMAGVGLMVEVVAHELARSTENALSAIEDLRRRQVPDQIRRLLESLGAEMKAISKRIRVLDPMSVSGRQRREVFDLAGLFESTLDGHQRQFARHRVELRLAASKRPLHIRAVKGMVVQILENLVSNSIYWLRVRRLADSQFNACITVNITANPLIVVYEDNGPGVAKEHQERVFLPFFSLKERARRRGLGLFIARECAKFHGGTLRLCGPIGNDGRLHRFVLELPDEASII